MKKPKRRIRKPSFFMYYFIAPLIILFLKIKYKFTKNKIKIRNGSLLIAPHRSYFDFLTIPYLVYPKRCHVVSTTYWYRDKRLVPLLNILGTIPKDQYRSDRKSILLMSDCFKNGDNVLMFPEGQMSIYSKNLPLPTGLDKLIKLYKPNVYFINPKGAYLSSPKWNRSFKKGRIDASIELLFKSEEIENYSLDEINKIIKDAYNKADDLSLIRDHKDYKFISKNRASGLENIIINCPKCGSLLSLETDKRHTGCKCCDFSLDFKNEGYEFEPNPYFKDLKDLFEFNDIKISELASKDLVLEDDARIVYIDENFNEISLYSDGKVIMDKEKAILMDKNGTDSLTILNDTVINYVITLNKSFEIPTPKMTYRIYTKNPRRVILYWNYLNKLKEINN